MQITDEAKTPADEWGLAFACLSIDGVEPGEMVACGILYDLAEDAIRVKDGLELVAHATGADARVVFRHDTKADPSFWLAIGPVVKGDVFRLEAPPARLVPVFREGGWK